MKQFSRLGLIAALFVSFLLIGTIPGLAQCDEGDPNCPIDPPQSVEVNPDAVESEGSTADVPDPAALDAVESDLSGGGPAIIDPVPLAPRTAIAPAFDKLTIPMRWQEPTDVSCGVQALGMAFEGLGEGSPSSPAILDYLQGEGMMYDFGTGVEEFALAAQNFGYEGTIPFHNWGLDQLQAELAEGRAPVVAIGVNGPGQPGHFVTVTGVSPDGQWVSYNDPTLGERAVTVEEFTRLWGLQGNSGVAVRKTVLTSEADIIPWVAFVAGLMAVISQTPWALQRKGIGGRLIAGGSPSRRKIQTTRRPAVSSLAGAPSRAARAASRRRPRRSRPVSSPPRDPSPQMVNQALAPERNTENLGWQAPEAEPEPVLEPVPSFFSNPLGWAQAKIINAGRQNDSVRNVMTSTMAPASDFFSSAADKERNPQTASWRESLIASYNNARGGWDKAINGAKALADYSISAVREGRWNDAGRAAKAWGQASAGTLAEATKATIKGTAVVAWGFVTTPVRLVTRTLPNFVRAIRERGEGKDRAWDVLTTGAFLEGDIAATYGLGKITGVTDKINAAAEARLFGSTNSVADSLMPGGNPIGNPGRGPGIRELPGGNAAAQRLFNELSAGGVDVTPPDYPGTLIELPGGGYIGYRPTSTSGGPTIDFNIAGIIFKKIHFP